jgi:hypothetical protein
VGPWWRAERIVATSMHLLVLASYYSLKDLDVSSRKNALEEMG